MTADSVTIELPAAFRARLDSLNVVSRRAHGNPQHGSRRSMRKGTSIEFADYRRYSPGDDIRQVDWNIYGRSDKLFVKVREAEELLAVHLLLDHSLSMNRGRSNKLNYARHLAAAIGYLALSGGDTVLPVGFSNRLDAEIPPVRNLAETRRLFAFLGGLKAGGQTSLIEPLREYAARRTPTGVLFLITDLLAPEGHSGIGMLAQRGHEVVVLHLLEKEDLEPDVGEDVELVDSETGDKLLLTGDAASVDRYKASLHRWLAEMSQLCNRFGVRYTAIETDWSVEDVVARRLRARGVFA